MLFIAACTLMLGCADTFARFYSETQQYKGKNINVLLDRIGDTDSQTFVGGRVVYTWTPVSPRQLESPALQAPPEGAPEPPLPVATAQPDDLYLHFRCELRVDTDGAGTILSLRWEGNPGSCAP